MVELMIYQFGKVVPDLQFGIMLVLNVAGP